MKGWIAESLPHAELRSLDFLAGCYTGVLTHSASDCEPPTRFRSTVQGSREECERFFRIEQFASIPTLGVVSGTTLFGYNRAAGRFECYGFSSAYEEPIVLAGGWQGDSLVLLSQPVPGPTGLDRYRHTYTPQAGGRWRFMEERWELEGYANHLVGTYGPVVPPFMP